MPFKWLAPPRDVYPLVVEDYTRTVMRTGKLVAEQMADEAEVWMKQNAPWQDVTGAAREGLGVDVIDAPGAVVQLVFHHNESIEYGVWLELSDNGRNAILAPAIDYWGPRLTQYLQRMVDTGILPRGRTG